MTAARIGVVIPYFQRAPGLLTRAVRSVLQQDGAPAAAIVVVDDGSPLPARTELAALPEAAAAGVRLIEQPNAGVSAARNRALDALPDEIDIVAFLDSDDAWHSGHLANACAALSVDYGFYFADHRREGAAKSRFAECGLTAADGTRLPAGRNLYRYDRDLFSDLLRKSPVGTPTVVFRRALGRDLRFAERLSANEDTLFWLSLVRHGARTAFCVDEEVTCGWGVNIYAGPVWGSPQMLKLIGGMAEFHRIVPGLLPLPADLAAWNTAWRRQLRRDFAMNLLHLVARTGGRAIPWQTVRHFVRAEPALAGDLLLAPGRMALAKIASALPSKRTSESSSENITSLGKRDSHL
jgi:succinoglycan biosynthesis protein ExoW